jgi:AhpD family alkylhydroperoxidase
MAQSPAVLEGFLAFNGALGSGILTAAVREQIALAVAGENACDYCASAHTFLAKAAGIDATEAARNLAGTATDPKVAAIISFARAVVRSRGLLVDPANSLNELRKAGLTEAEIVETLAHVGLNLFTNYFNHVANTEIDFPFVTAAASISAA